MLVSDVQFEFIWDKLFERLEEVKYGAMGDDYK